MHVIDPRYLTAINWTGQMTPLLSNYGPIPRLTEPSRWKAWAQYVGSLPRIAALNPPNPALYPTWQEWATQFNLTVGVL